MKKIELRHKDIQDIIDKINNILKESFLHKGDSKIGWRNGLSPTDKPDAGATATALVLTYCRKTNCEIYIKDNGKEENISAYFSDLIESLLSMKRGEGSDVYWERRSFSGTPCINATVAVISALNDWRFNQLYPEIQQVIGKSAEWLFAQKKELQKGKNRPVTWGVNKNDAGRVFVTCDVLSSIIPLKIINKNDMETAVEWIVSAKKQDGNDKCYWGYTAAPTTPSIYHTAKVLNFLHLYKSHANDGKILKAYNKGMKYIHEFVDKDNFTFDTCESCALGGGLDPNDFYHDTFSELIQLMLNTRSEWSAYDICKVVKKYIDFYNENSEEPWKKNGEINIWLLIPTAMQLYNILHSYLPKHNDIIIIYEDGTMLVDPQSNKMEWFERYPPAKIEYRRIAIVILIIFVIISAIFYIVGFAYFPELLIIKITTGILTLLGFVSALFFEFKLDKKLLSKIKKIHRN